MPKTARRQRKDRLKQSHNEYTSHSNHVNHRQFPLRGETRITGREAQFTDELGRTFIEVQSLDYWKERFTWIEDLLPLPTTDRFYWVIVSTKLTNEYNVPLDIELGTIIHGKGQVIYCKTDPTHHSVVGAIILRRSL